MERMQPKITKAVGQIGNDRLVRDCGVGVGRAALRFCRILPRPSATHAAMASGAEIIVQAVLEDGRWV